MLTVYKRSLFYSPSFPHPSICHDLVQLCCLAVLLPGDSFSGPVGFFQAAGVKYHGPGAFVPQQGGIGVAVENCSGSGSGR